MTTPDWRVIKKLCETGMACSTTVCLDPNTEEKDRTIAASEARIYQQILDLQRPRVGQAQFQGENPK